MEKRSPFSIDHDWRFVPTLLEDDSAGHAPIRVSQETVALRAIGYIGIIGSVQIGRLFGFKRHHIRRMIAEKKLVQHALYKNKNTIPVFTTGPRASKLLGLPYENNRWHSWTTEQILQKLVYFQLCCSLQDKQKIYQIHEGAYPFAGKIEIAGEIRQVLVIRKPIEKLGDQIRHQTNPIIVVVESLAHVQPYNELLNDARLLLDEDLGKDYRFLKYRNGGWGN